ncbi:rod-binding protein [Buchnera aphidicola]|uniref:rod-binding protein n=1 Tax=Buchnera aphidicola TaxID=9 RepID=UPI003463885B
MENNFNIFITPTYSNNTLSLSAKKSEKNIKNNLFNTAKKVEGLFLNIILTNMRNSLPKNDLFNNETERMYTDIYDQTMSQQISKKGFGLAEIIVEQILKKNILKKNYQ